MSTHVAQPLNTAMVLVCLRDVDAVMLCNGSNMGLAGGFSAVVSWVVWFPRYLQLPPMVYFNLGTLRCYVDASAVKMFIKPV